MRVWVLTAFLITMAGLVGCSKGDKKGHSVIALLTDYGLQDAYVAELKGSILTVNPGAQIVDLTHEVEPFNLKEASYLINQASREFPAQTIFVCVVDPGVGTDRASILVHTKADKYYIGPDNGIFTLVVEREGFSKAWKLDKPQYFRKGEMSGTFHGRDIFGPIAAHLAAGVSPDSLGSEFPKLQTLAYNSPQLIGPIASGEIVHVDHFGNLISNIPAQLSPNLKDGNLTRITINGQTVSAPFVKAYGDVPKGHLCLITNSQGNLEIAVNYGSAAQELKAQVGTTFSVR